jgi:acetyl-CoA carboxylase carboxyltransferase component
MRELLARVVDASEFEEYRAEYGETVLCVPRALATGRSASSPIRKTCTNHRARPDQKRIEFGGVIYAESAKKRRASLWTAIRTLFR